MQQITKTLFPVKGADSLRTEIFPVFMKQLDFVKHYRTDILVEYEFAMKNMDKGEDFVRFVGFRESGVDHKEFMYGHKFTDYIAVYKYEVSFDGEDRWTAVLWLLDEHDFNETFKA